MHDNLMIYDRLFPFISNLTEDEKQLVKNSIDTKTFHKGEIVNRSDDGCAGLIAVVDGQLRTYIISEEGREITLFRVGSEEICVLSVSCLLDSIIFDVVIEAIEDTTVYIIPVNIIHGIEEQNAYVGLFLYKSAAEKFSEVMWTMQQLLFMRLDQRIAIFLWDEINRKEGTTLAITHEMIAHQISSSREVVTKVMKYFENEEIIKSGRGKIIVIDKQRLKKAAYPANVI